jgi:hypothetical protein
MTQHETWTVPPGMTLSDGSGGAQKPVVASEVTFTETAGAGTYTGRIALPAGATILDVTVVQVAQWTAATSAVMQVGDAGDAAGFISALDLKTAAAGAVYAFGSLGAWGSTPAGAYVQQAGSDGSFLALYSAGARTITGTVVTVGGGGTAGRTRLVVSYAAATPTAATKI